MPNSVLWICLVAIWLFVLIPMVIQGRPELRKSTPVAAATRVIKRGEEAVRTRRIGAGAHPHDPDYQKPATSTEPTAPAKATAKADTNDEGSNNKGSNDEVVDPSRIPGKVPQRKRTRTVAARMRRVVSVTATRSTADDVTEVIPVVAASDKRVTAGSLVDDGAILVDDGAIIDAELVEEKGTETLEVQAVEVIDVEVTERIDPVADESPTERIEKVADESAATLFDIETDSAIPDPEVESESVEVKAEADSEAAPEDVVERSAADIAEGGSVDEVVDEADELDELDEVDDLEELADSGDSADADLEDADLEDDELEDDEFESRWDDIDPNELTQVMMTRPGRGGYDPEVDRERLEIKYKERQRVLLALVGITLLTIGAGVLLGTVGWIVAGVAGFVLVAYLVFLRRAVKSEAQIRDRRVARLERSRREEVARRRRELLEAPEAEVAVPTRPRMRRPSGMLVVEFDDEDPAFDHLPTYQQPRMMRSDEGYRATAVG